MIFQWTEAGLAAIEAAGMQPTLILGEMRLFSNNVGYDWNRVVGDLVEAAWTGYGPVTITAPALSPLLQDPIGLNVFLKLPMKKIGTCTALPETDYGMFLTDAATGLILWGMAVFDEPQFIAVGDTLWMNMLFSLGLGVQQSSIEVDLAG